MKALGGCKVPGTGAIAYCRSLVKMFLSKERQIDV
jgi:hypothetical protein